MNLNHSTIAAIILNTLVGCYASADEMSHHTMSGMGASEHEAAYMAENETAMAKMMAQMDVKPTGDVDRDFVAMMTPHHQGAIDMAVAVVEHGKNEQIRRIAQKMITDQQEEITAMKQAVGEPQSATSNSQTACVTKCARNLLNEDHN